MYGLSETARVFSLALISRWINVLLLDSNSPEHAKYYSSNELW